MPPILTASNLHKTYRLGRVRVPVLRGVDLSIAEGEFVAVLGSSGSGKSTLLHLLGGLDRPDTEPAPTIGFRGDRVTSMSAGALDRYRRASVGFVFQFYHLLPELTVLENVTIASLIAGAPAREFAAALLADVGLSHRLEHRPAELSGGERQRVAIARALVNKPPLLLADEPTGNLDHATGATILDMLEKLRRDHGHTMVVVTHDAETARRAGRVVRLADGRVEN
ncbi:MAG TPA: ABC transporter ATP-binding protein [Phycisphaerales bacterium]|nr:ABC transporter ATP-binding protein [Phycisphaerales bacterium]